MRNVLRIRENVLTVDSAWRSPSGVISSWIVQMVPMRETVVSAHKLCVCVVKVHNIVGRCLGPPSLHDPGQFLIPLVVFIWFVIVPFGWVSLSTDKGIEFTSPIIYVPDNYKRSVLDFVSVLLHKFPSRHIF
jgi:hypothetical protein